MRLIGKEPQNLSESPIEAKFEVGLGPAMVPLGGGCCCLHSLRWYRVANRCVSHGISRSNRWGCVCSSVLVFGACVRESVHTYMCVRAGMLACVPSLSSWSKAVFGFDVTKDGVTVPAELKPKSVAKASEKQLHLPKNALLKKKAPYSSIL
jgi:hypothetical protein